VEKFLDFRGRNLLVQALLAGLLLFAGPSACSFIVLDRGTGTGKVSSVSKGFMGINYCEITYEGEHFKYVVPSDKSSLLDFLEQARNSGERITFEYVETLGPKLYRGELESLTLEDVSN